MGNHRSAVNSANASKQKQSFWNAEREATLRNLWSAGEFTSTIAAALGPGCTQAMVIGKANRLHLCTRKDWARFGPGRHKAVIRVSRETNGVVA